MEMLFGLLSALIKLTLVIGAIAGLFANARISRLATSGQRTHPAHGRVMRALERGAWGGPTRRASGPLRRRSRRRPQTKHRLRPGRRTGRQRLEEPDEPVLGWLLKLVLTVVIVRLTFNPWLPSYPQDVHWSLWTYGGAAAFAALCLRAYPRLARWAEGAAAPIAAGSEQSARGAAD